MVSGILAIGLTVTVTSGLARSAGLPSTATQPAVAVDPGHGGRDAGARGAAGHLEKTICLQLANKLAQRLANSYRVILTRRDDSYVELRQRSAIANQADAALLLSLHTGAGFVNTAGGISIYYDAPLHGTAGDKASTSETTAPTPWNQTQTRHHAESLTLATTLKEYLEQMPDAPACSVHGAPLPLLQGTDMPAVLIELGPITHPATEAILTSAQGQEQLSEQIAQAVQAFMSGFQKRNNPARPAWHDRDADRPVQ